MLFPLTFSGSYVLTELQSGPYWTLTKLWSPYLTRAERVGINLHVAEHFDMNCFNSVSIQWFLATGRDFPDTIMVPNLPLDQDEIILASWGVGQCCFAARTERNKQIHSDVCSRLFNSPVIVLEYHLSARISHGPLYIDTTMFLSLHKYLKLLKIKQKKSYFLTGCLDVDRWAFTFCQS